MNETRSKHTKFAGIEDFLFHQFYVRLLDYSFLLKARQEEVIHESVTLYHHKLIRR